MNSYMHTPERNMSSLHQIDKNTVNTKNKPGRFTFHMGYNLLYPLPINKKPETRFWGPWLIPNTFPNGRAGFSVYLIFVSIHCLLILSDLITIRWYYCNATIPIEISLEIKTNSPEDIIRTQGVLSKGKIIKHEFVK